MNFDIPFGARSARYVQRLRASLLILAVIACIGGGQSVRAADTPPTLAVLPFEVEDTSGEVGPNNHDAMLARATTITAEQIAASGIFSVVPQQEVSAAVAEVNSGTHLRRCNGCELDIAARAGARYVLIGWINKVSTLVLSFHIDIKNAKTGKPVYSRAFDFRGDNEKAYAHAVRTMVRSLKETIGTQFGVLGSGAGDKTRIAVFKFELEDKSAGGGIISEDEHDRKYLTAATDEAERLLTASGRFSVVGTDNALLAETARTFGIRNCGGCEAAAARSIGGDEAMIGVITRVNRTEHTLLIKIVDARTGAAISTSFTDLRMGANYAWPRSVTRLMNQRVLADSPAK